MSDESISELKESIRINPNDGMAHNNLGATYIQKGMLDESIAECKEAIRINPNLAMAYNNLGVDYYNKKQYNLAIQYFDEAIKLGDKPEPKFLKALEPYRKK